jgi:hypothetical protein
MSTLFPGSSKKRGPTRDARLFTLVGKKRVEHDPDTSPNLMYRVTVEYAP